MVHRRIKAYWHPEKNVGDTLTPVLLSALGFDVEKAGREDEGKLLGVGSIIQSSLRKGDIVWGSGIIKEKEVQAPAGVRFLAIRGKLSRALIKGADVPEVYGDPALLLPLIFKPDVKITHRIGIIPHYVDFEVAQKGFPILNKDGHYKLIDVRLPWKDFITEVLSCETIVSSSLHGIVIAEAYGRPANWQVWSDKVIGDGFKFKDYLTGTGRNPQEPGWLPPIPNLKAIQDGLTEALKNI